MNYFSPEHKTIVLYYIYQSKKKKKSSKIIPFLKTRLANWLYFSGTIKPVLHRRQTHNAPVNRHLLPSPMHFLAKDPSLIYIPGPNSNCAVLTLAMTEIPSWEENVAAPSQGAATPPRQLRELHPDEAAKGISGGRM